MPGRKGGAEGGKVGFIYLILLWYVFWDTGGLTMPPFAVVEGVTSEASGYYSCSAHSFPIIIYLRY